MYPVVTSVSLPNLEASANHEMNVGLEMGSWMWPFTVPCGISKVVETISTRAWEASLVTN